MWWHKNFFLLAWGILIDIALVCVRNFKIKNSYILIHGFLLLFIDLGTLIIFVMTLYYNWSNLIFVPGWLGCHYVNGLIFFILIILNHTGGVII